MAQVVTSTQTFNAAGPIGQHLRVITPGALALAGDSDVELGTMDKPCLGAGPATVLLRTAEGSTKFVANTQINAGVDVYAAANGKVAASGTVLIGTSVTEASGDGAVLSVVRR
jgi:hypothetical protein